jgi:hypothetical protein
MSGSLLPRRDNFIVRVKNNGLIAKALLTQLSERDGMFQLTSIFFYVIMDQWIVLIVNGTVTYKPHPLTRHQRAQAHNSTPNSRRTSFI